MFYYLKIKAVAAVCEDIAVRITFGFRYTCTLPIQYIAFGADAPRLDEAGNTLTLCLQVLAGTLTLGSSTVGPFTVL